MPTSRANVNTANASSYLRRLCQHWSHSFPVEFNDERGTIQLQQSTCVLNASPELLTIRLTVEGGADDARLRTIVEEHLQRFGCCEELVFEWNSTGLTLEEGASNLNENPACVAALRVEILSLQQLVAELLLKNQRLRHALENVETVLTDRSVEASPQPAILSSLWLSALGVISGEEQSV
ncbi:MAG TPA: DUF2218 domain-containing protein [Terracidiphilus sp.]|jgi:hypothetical protein